MLQRPLVRGWRVVVSFGWCSWPGVIRSAAAGSLLCLQGLKERAYASSGEAITSLPVSIPLSTVQPSKLPVSIPLASVVLPNRAEKVVSGHRRGAGAVQCMLLREYQHRQKRLLSGVCPTRPGPFLLNCMQFKFEKNRASRNPGLITLISYGVCFCCVLIFIQGYFFH